MLLIIHFMVKKLYLTSDIFTFIFLDMKYIGYKILESSFKYLHFLKCFNSPVAKTKTPKYGGNDVSV